MPPVSGEDRDLFASLHKEGLAFLEQKDYLRAVHTLSSACGILKDAQGMFDLGWALYHNKKLDEAEKTLLDGHSLCASPHALGHLRLAAVRCERGSFSAAARSAQAALKFGVGVLPPADLILAGSLLGQCLAAQAETPVRPSHAGISPSPMSASGESPPFRQPEITATPKEQREPKEGALMLSARTASGSLETSAQDTNDKPPLRSRILALGRDVRSYLTSHPSVLEALLRDPTSVDVLEHMPSAEDRLNCLGVVLDTLVGSQGGSGNLDGYEVHWEPASVASKFVAQCLPSIDPTLPPKWGGFLLRAVTSPDKAWPKDDSVTKKLFVKILGNFEGKSKDGTGKGQLKKFIVVNDGVWPWSPNSADREMVHWAACMWARRFMRLLLIEQMFDHARRKFAGKDVKRMDVAELDNTLKEVPGYYQYLCKHGTALEEPLKRDSKSKPPKRSLTAKRGRSKS